jgi:hypothetical protein
MRGEPDRTATAQIRAEQWLAAMGERVGLIGRAAARESRD